MQCITFIIDLGSEQGLGSWQGKDALEVRHAMETDMATQGLNVDGGGMGMDYMEIFVYAEDAAAAAAVGKRIVNQYGFQVEIDINDCEEG